MAVAFRSVATANAGGATSLAVTAPSGLASGDLLIAQVVTDGLTEPTITAPTGWTSLRNDPAVHVFQQWFYKIAGASEPGSYTFSFSSSVDTSIAIADYTGADATTPIPVSGGNSGLSGTSTAPSVTTTTVNNFILCAFATENTQTLTLSGSLTSRWNPSVGGSGLSYAGGDEAQAATGASGTHTATFSGSVNWVASTLAIQPTQALTWSASDAQTLADSASAALPGALADSQALTDSAPAFATPAPPADGQSFGSQHPYWAAVLADAPAAFFPLNEPAASTTVADQSGNLHSGTVAGTVTFGQTGDAAEPLNQSHAATFDGSTGEITLDSGLNPTGWGAITLEIVNDPTSTANNPRYLTNGHTDSTNTGVQLWNNGGNLSGNIGLGASYANVSTALAANTGWHHAVLTYDGSNARLYVDGALAATGGTDAGTIASSGKPFVIGKGYTGSDTAAATTMQGVAVYPVALSAARILAHYQALTGIGLVATTLEAAPADALTSLDGATATMPNTLADSQALTDSAPASAAVSATVALTALTDTFSGRTIVSGWGGTSDGTDSWTRTNGVAASFSVSSGEGRMVYDSTDDPAAVLTLHTVGDVELLARFTPVDSGGYLGFYLHYTDLNNYTRVIWYAGSNVLCQTFVAGSPTNVFYTSYSRTIGTATWMRVRCQGQQVSVRLWPDGQAEPTVWLGTVTATAMPTTPGQVGIQLSTRTVSTTALVDSFTLAPLGVGDGQSVVDGASASNAAQPADAVTTLDSATAILPSQPPADGQAFADTSTATVAALPSDAQTATDASAALLPGGLPADTQTLADALAASATPHPSDALAPQDASTATLPASVGDVTVNADAGTANLQAAPITDSQRHADTWTVPYWLAFYFDSLVTQDTLAAILASDPPADALASLDSSTAAWASVFPADGQTLADASTAVATPQPADMLASLDSAAAWLPATASDAVVLADGATAILPGQPLTDVLAPQDGQQGVAMAAPTLDTLIAQDDAVAAFLAAPASDATAHADSTTAQLPSAVPTDGQSHTDADTAQATAATADALASLDSVSAALPSALPTDAQSLADGSAAWGVPLASDTITSQDGSAAIGTPQVSDAMTPADAGMAVTTPASRDDLVPQDAARAILPSQPLADGQTVADGSAASATPAPPADGQTFADAFAAWLTALSSDANPHQDASAGSLPSALAADSQTLADGSAASGTPLATDAQPTPQDAFSADLAALPVDTNPHADATSATLPSQLPGDAQAFVDAVAANAAPVLADAQPTPQDTFSAIIAAQPVDTNPHLDSAPSVLVTVRSDTQPTPVDLWLRYPFHGYRFDAGITDAAQGNPGGVDASQGNAGVTDAAQGDLAIVEAQDT